MNHAEIPDADDTLLVYCSCPDDDTGKRLARLLVEANLAAGVNLIPGLWSIYHWAGEIETADEQLMLIETTARRYPALEKKLIAAHPYELPKIVAVPIHLGLPDYLQWVRTHCAAT